jgi:glucose-1-phosphate thymidylyltransferase
MSQPAALSREVIGLIPAGGVSERLSPLPCSKEIYPIGFRDDDLQRGRRPKVACHHLLEEMRRAGIRKAYVVLRKGKWDIPSYLGDGKVVDMNLGYLMMDLPYGPPYTLNQASPFVKNTVVAFGFPDILFQSENGFRKLLSHQNDSNADVVLGLFPADHPEQVDMIDVDEKCQVREILIQSRDARLRYSWAIAVWTPAFTEFLQSFLAARTHSAAVQSELSVGVVIQAAIDAGLCVDGVAVSKEPYLDIGTPEGLAKAVARFASGL